MVPREKRSRHSKKHNRRAKAIAPSPGVIYEVSDLRQCFYCRNFIPKSKSLTDCICDGFISPESVLDVPGLTFSSLWPSGRCSLTIPTRAKSHPHPHPHLHFHHVTPITTTSLHPLTHSPSHLSHLHPPSSSLSSDSDDCESDDGYICM